MSNLTELPPDASSRDPRFFGSARTTVIEPSRGWRAVDLGELWAYRELIWVLTVRDVKVRYKQTVLGVTWAVIQPVLTMVVFSIFFGRLAKIPSDGYPYPVFVYAALLPWLFFAGSVSQSAGSLVGSAHLVSKVYFPRLIIPIAGIGVGLVDLAISTCVLLVVMVVYGVGFGAHLLLAPLLLIAVVLTALGVGIGLCALNVAYRDFRYVVPFMIQIWLFLTPVVYPVTMVPERWHWLIFLNPMSGIIEGFRAAFLGKPFDLGALGISAMVAVAMFVAGVAYFERVERRFADII